MTERLAAATDYLRRVADSLAKALTSTPMQSKWFLGFFGVPRRVLATNTIENPLSHSLLGETLRIDPGSYLDSNAVRRVSKFFRGRWGGTGHRRFLASARPNLAPGGGLGKAPGLLLAPIFSPVDKF